MGIFSLAGAAGFVGGLEKAIAEDKEKMFKKIEARTSLFTTDALEARKKRRDRTQQVRDQYDTAVTMFGGDEFAGNLAESVAKLTPEKFSEFLKTYETVKADAKQEGRRTNLSALGYIEPISERIQTDMVVDPTGMGVSTSDITARKLAVDSDAAVNRIMGVVDNTDVGVDKTENESMRSALRKSFGSLSDEDIASEAEREAAANLRMSVKEFRRLTSDEGITGTSGAVPGVQIGAVSDPTVVLDLQAKKQAAKASEKQLDLLNVQIDNARITNTGLEEANVKYTMTYGGEEFEGSAKQHAARLDAITKKQNFDIAEEARRLGKPLAIGEINTFNKALSTFTGVLGDNTLIFNNASNMYVPSSQTKEDGMLALVIGNAYRAQEQAGLRMQPNQSILDLTAQYLEPSKPAGDILTSIREAEAAEGYVEGSTTTASPYLNALNRASVTVRSGMRAKIERLAGEVETDPPATLELTDQWDATSNIENLNQRVRAFITSADIGSQLSSNIRRQDKYSDFINQAAGAVRGIDMNDAAAVREAILSIARQIDEE